MPKAKGASASTSSTVSEYLIDLLLFLLHFTLDMTQANHRETGLRLDLPATKVDTISSTRTAKLIVNEIPTHTFGRKQQNSIQYIQYTDYHSQLQQLQTCRMRNENCGIAPWLFVPVAACKKDQFTHSKCNSQLQRSP